MTLQSSLKHERQMLQDEQSKASSLETQLAKIQQEVKNASFNVSQSEEQSRLKTQSEEQMAQ